MNQEHDTPTAFEQRTRALLRDSAEGLDGATRSRLARARAAALEARAPRGGWLRFRYLAPAGAMAAAVLVTVLFIGRGPQPVNEVAGGALDDMELLADADAFELSQENDLEFIEWAAGMSAEGAPGI